MVHLNKREHDVMFLILGIHENSCPKVRFFAVWTTHNIGDGRSPRVATGGPKLTGFDRWAGVRIFAFPDTSQSVKEAIVITEKT